MSGACREIDYLMHTCRELQLNVQRERRRDRRGLMAIRGPSDEPICIGVDPAGLSIIEQVLRGLRFDFHSLPLLVRGDSKEIRLLTPHITVARLIPSVYSFTYNRYGEAPGTEEVRTRFSAAVFREMAAKPGPFHLCSAFLGLIESADGPLLAEELVETCNLEVRVKRYHIGSPCHRYRYTDRHRTAFGADPLKRWSRFSAPIVCFDWRHPLTDEAGSRLADEPLPDDYAAVWMNDVAAAKELARNTFEWLESRFMHAGLRLIDICFFIDRTGRVLFGEISPDCMRIRTQASADGESFDKDRWRSGGSPEEVLERYRLLYDKVFGGKMIGSHQQQEEHTMANYMHAKGPPTEVRNHRLKMSPGGIVTLPVAARKSLRMEKARGSRVSVAVGTDSVTLAPAGRTGGFRVSSGGQLELLGDARAVLERGTMRHFWIELRDAAGQVVLHPQT